MEDDVDLSQLPLYLLQSSQRLDIFAIGMLRLGIISILGNFVSSYGLKVPVKLDVATIFHVS